MVLDYSIIIFAIIAVVSLWVFLASFIFYVYQ